MVKKGKLLLALDAQKGRDYEAEKKKKQVKAANKRKTKRVDHGEETLLNGDETEENGHVALQPEDKKTNGDFEAFESDNENESEEDEEGGGVIPQPETGADASASEAEQESDLDLSDLEEEDREDVVPHQRMTINNGPALVTSRKRIAVVSDKEKGPFHHHNSLVSADRTADELIPDPMDDETRELMFYKIARDATLTARGLLKKEKVPFTRPADYFAEMVKTDDHMGRIKKKLYDEAAGKKAAEEARRLRDAKKFGKQVQVAKEQERAKEKKDTLGKIQELKRKRKDNDTGRVTEGDNLFQDINVDNELKSRRDRDDKNSGNTKRQKKDSKFGFGGRKRYSKSGTAESSADMKGFSVKRMKGKGKPPQRPGKSRRAAGRS